MIAVERRRMPRMDTAIRIECLDGSSPLYAQDVSLGGMLVTTAVPRWPGSLIRVRFKLPTDRRPIEATLRVVNLVEVPRGVGLALRFLRLAPAAKMALHAYLDDRPHPEHTTFAVSERVEGWMKRIVDDCDQLAALAR